MVWKIIFGYVSSYFPLKLIVGLLVYKWQKVLLSHVSFFSLDVSGRQHFESVHNCVYFAVRVLDYQYE